MSKNYMTTSTDPLSELLFNGRIYKIPKFQRDYSWKKENWEDLWNDIMRLYDGENDIHYMGAVIFKRTGELNTFEVIDGQQRLATIIILGVAAIKFLTDLINKGIETEANKKRIDALKQYFVERTSAATLLPHSKLELNRNDQPFFEDVILRMRKLKSTRKLPYSHRLLYSAFQYFYEQISQKFNGDNGYKIGYFIEEILGPKLLFTQIFVEDDVNAYSVFETLNARGIALAPTDLLKNYLFSLVKAEHDLQLLQSKWYRIIEKVKFEKFPSFLRYYLNSKRQLVRSRQLFKILKGEIKDCSQALELIDDLEQYADLFYALNNPYDEFWNDFDQNDKIRKHIEALNLFNVTQHYPLIFAVYNTKAQLLEAALRMSMIIAFRYLIISGMNPNDMEKVYNKAAIAVSNEQISTARDLFNYLKTLYINDDKFSANFEFIHLNTSRHKALVKFILVNLENAMDTKSEHDWKNSTITIEHILPENYSDEWLDSFDPQQAEQMIYRLGNLTLLEPSLNRRAANADFEQKKQIYLESKFILTKQIAENYETWDVAAISKRQRSLAKLATQIWRLDY